ncbi:MAG: TetR/AcrR family transcriptional regulator [Gammaproteobacteria bacterium]|nr:TetR/AcrR family transcriptional regulator [Gammaproteobacteria bacterium]
MQSESLTTRQRILQTAFEEMHRHGFQGMRIDSILTKTGLKKGALYHHFASKLELGYAVVDEVIGEQGRLVWVEPLFDHDDPLLALETVFRNAGDSGCIDFILGCPLNNLAQEMSPVDSGFRTRIQAIYQTWLAALIERLRTGQKNQHVRADIDVGQCATFILASIEGAIGLAKNAQDRELYLQCGKQLNEYLNSLRP